VTTLDWPLFGVGVFVGCSLLIVANDLLGFASLDARVRSRYATLFLVLSIGGAIGLGLVVRLHAPATPCRTHASAR
jgi:hypothetical protein